MLREDADGERVASRARRDGGGDAASEPGIRAELLES
jgi:hypothetical protein